MIRDILSSAINDVVSDVTGGTGLPSGPYPTVQALWHKEPIGGSEASERYQWNMDGQSMFWSAGFVWSTASASSGFSYSLIGSNAANTSINDDLGIDGSGNIIWSSFAGETATLNGNVITSGTAQFEVGEINLITIIGTYSGSIDRHGSNLAGSKFYPAAISALMLIDGASPANSYTYKLSGNGANETAIGLEIGAELVTMRARYNWTVQPAFAIRNLGFTATSGIQYYAEVDLRGGTSGDVKINATAGDSIFFAAGTFNTVLLGLLDGPVSLQISSPGNEYRGESLVTIKELPVSALTRQNGEPDGSDIERITRKADNSGWTGDGSNEYDYAPGAND